MAHETTMAVDEAARDVMEALGGEVSGAVEDSVRSAFKPLKTSIEDILNEKLDAGIKASSKKNEEALRLQREQIEEFSRSVKTGVEDILNEKLDAGIKASSKKNKEALCLQREQIEEFSRSVKADIAALSEKITAVLETQNKILETLGQIKGDTEYLKKPFIKKLFAGEKK